MAVASAPRSRCVRRGDGVAELPCQLNPSSANAWMTEGIAFMRSKQFCRFAGRSTPLLPNNSRGGLRVDDRGVFNGILWRFRTGNPWADVPERYGPHTTCYNRFVRWRRAGVWNRLLKAISSAFDGNIQMIDSSCVRVHQHGATGKKGAPIEAWDVPEAA